MFSLDIQEMAQKVVDSYKKRSLKIVTAESCTGGLVAGALTSIPGSSVVLERGFISYSNDAKVEVLGVIPELLDVYGAVSNEVAEAMVQGALEYSRADVGISITGIAGPGGATMNKPVGLVHFGLAIRSGTLFHYQCLFKGDRNDVRSAAIYEALRLLYSVNIDP